MSKKVTTNKHRHDGRKRRLAPYVSRKHLLTPGERRFYRFGLEPAVRGRYLVAFKPRLADLIATESEDIAHFRKIAMKHVDWALATPRTTRIVAAIELNDSSHLESERQSRDAFVADALHAAGVPLICFPIFRDYSAKKIRWHIRRAIGEFSSRP